LPRLALAGCGASKAAELKAEGFVHQKWFRFMAW
jgi:hypothetical protein